MSADIESTIKMLSGKISIIPDSTINILGFSKKSNCLVPISEDEKGNSEEKKKPTLIIISGFSKNSFQNNYEIVMKHLVQSHYDEFEQILFVQFQDDDKFSIRGLHMSFHNEKGIIFDGKLENSLYEKCASIIRSKLPKNNSYIILAKSAGAGVGIYLSQNIPDKITKMFLFAPGIGYLALSITELKVQSSNIIVGWNEEDSKVPKKIVWEKVGYLFPGVEVNMYKMDIAYNEEGKQIDTQHEN